MLASKLCPAWRGRVYVRLRRLLALPYRLPPPSKPNTDLEGNSEGKPAAGLCQGSKFPHFGRMLTLAMVVWLKHNMTRQDVVLAWECCHLPIGFLDLSNNLYFCGKRYFCIYFRVFCLLFLLKNSLVSLFQPPKKQLNDWTSKVWALLQTTVTGRKINGFLLMTHISPLWWSEAMD